MQSTTRFLCLLLAGLTTTGLALTVPSPALACGGLFCSTAQPVNQAAERIIFADNGDGTVTAVIQILYQGPSEQFAWVLPVPGVPDVDVSSDIALQRLQNATNPFYQMTTVIEGDCADGFGRGGIASPTAGGADAGVEEQANGGGGVTVLAAATAGPYDYEVISVDPDLSDPADVAIDWLEQNGYDVGALGSEVLGPYLADGMNLIAFRLTKGSDSGSIRPIVMTYTTENPMIPIRPTAVAANDDMGVMVWVLGEHRAIPLNYFSLELNEALINWFNPGGTYNDVVITAANEAGGQGFVTEFAGDTSGLSGIVFTSFDRSNWETIEAGDWEGEEFSLLQQLVWQFGTWDGFEDAVRQGGSFGEDFDVAAFINCFNDYYYDYGYGDVSEDCEGDLESITVALLLTAMDDLVIEPVRATQELLDSLPYTTRLYTTLSADEMTLDPVFDFNPDVGDVDNNHTATRTIHCSSDVEQFDAPWTVALPQGDTVWGQGQSWPFAVGEELPANRLILAMSTSGPGEVITDNSAAISDEIQVYNADFESSVSGCGCSAAAGNGGTSGWLLLLVPLAILIRRRVAGP